MTALLGIVPGGRYIHSYINLYFAKEAVDREYNKTTQYKKESLKYRELLAF